MEKVIIWKAIYLQEKMFLLVGHINKSWQTQVWLAMVFPFPPPSFRQWSAGTWPYLGFTITRERNLLQHWLRCLPSLKYLFLCKIEIWLILTIVWGNVIHVSVVVEVVVVQIVAVLLLLQGDGCVLRWNRPNVELKTSRFWRNWRTSWVEFRFIKG